MSHNNHSSTITFELNSEILAAKPSLRNEIEEWLQVDNGPIYEWKDVWTSSVDPTKEFQSKYDALQSVKSSINVAVIKNVSSYHGKDWYFYYANEYFVITDSNVDLTLTPFIVFRTSNEHLAVEFKIKFL